MEGAINARPKTSVMKPGVNKTTADIIRMPPEISSIVGNSPFWTEALIRLGWINLQCERAQILYRCGEYHNYRVYRSKMLTNLDD